MVRQVSVLLAAVAPFAASVSSDKAIKGICYGPVPFKGQATIPDDDFMSEDVKPLWGMRGRNDLAMIKAMGANAVRLYGNNPEDSHTRFLDTALGIGLRVIAGLSDFPFVQMRTGPGSCVNPNYGDLYDCYEQVRDSYLSNLRDGFLDATGGYHPALDHIIIINEPDLKLYNMDKGDKAVDPKTFIKGVISAIDGILSAEQEAGVSGRLVKFTVTFSFAVCSRPVCEQAVGQQDKPALGQMLELRNGLLYPRAYGYTPKNDLAAFYRTRFFNSANTANPSIELPGLLLDAYTQAFPDVPMMFEEFHSYHVRQDDDLQSMMKIVQRYPLLLGFSFFEFQVRYDKGGEEMNFGMFGLGNYPIATAEFQNAAGNYTVWCLIPVNDPLGSRSIPASVALAFGSTSMIDWSSLCMPDPATVDLNADGFLQIKALSPDKMVAFVRRAVENMGGLIVNQAGFGSFAATVPNWEAMVATLNTKPSFAHWDSGAACVADRLAPVNVVGHAIQDACLKTWFDCSNIPVECNYDLWKRGDYVLSTYFIQVGGQPLVNCSFDGGAAFVRESIYRSQDKSCVVTRNPNTTTLSDEGYQAILNQKDAAKAAIFIGRVITERMHGQILDQSGLVKLSATPPTSLLELTLAIKDAEWVCGGQTGGCDGPVRKKRLWWLPIALATVAGVIVTATICTCVYVRLPPEWRPESWCKFIGESDDESDSMDGYIL